MRILSSIFGSPSSENNKNNNNDTLIKGIDEKACKTQLCFGNLLAQSSETQLPSGFQLRRLEISDYDKYYVELLSQLTLTGPMSREQFEVCTFYNIFNRT